MDRAEEIATEGGEIPEELALEIKDYLEALRSKVDRIAGYWHWQESIAAICAQEADRLLARKTAAERRLNRLKEMLLYFMISRGLKKLDGDKATIGLQVNGTASLRIDDPSQIDDCFFENRIRVTRHELKELIEQLPEGELRRRLELVPSGDGWEINGSAVRSAILNNRPVTGARLAKGHHLRLR